MMLRINSALTPVALSTHSSSVAHPTHSGKGLGKGQSELRRRFCVQALNIRRDTYVRKQGSDELILDGGTIRL